MQERERPAIERIVTLQDWNGALKTCTVTVCSSGMKHYIDTVHDRTVIVQNMIKRNWNSPAHDWISAAK